MRLLLQVLFPAVAAIILVFVWSISVANNGGLAATFNPGDPAVLSYNIFRLAGLTAFTLIGFQVATGPFMKLWEGLYGPKFYRFHAFEGITALLFALLHPTLLLVSLGYQNQSLLEFVKTQPVPYYFGPAALLLLLITVPTAAAAVLLKRPTFKKSWHWLHLLNYLVFILVFFHSLTVGSDVAPAMSQLRPLWYAFLAALVIGFLYRRVYRVTREGQSGLNH